MPTLAEDIQRDSLNNLSNLGRFLAPRTQSLLREQEQLQKEQSDLIAFSQDKALQDRRFENEANLQKQRLDFQLQAEDDRAKRNQERQLNTRKEEAVGNALALDLDIETLIPGINMDNLSIADVARIETITADKQRDKDFKRKTEEIQAATNDKLLLEGQTAESGVRSFGDQFRPKNLIEQPTDLNNRAAIIEYRAAAANAFDTASQIDAALKEVNSGAGLKESGATNLTEAREKLRDAATLKRDNLLDQMKSLIKERTGEDVDISRIGQLMNQFAGTRRTDTNAEINTKINNNPILQGNNKEQIEAASDAFRAILAKEESASKLSNDLAGERLKVLVREWAFARKYARDPEPEVVEEETSVSTESAAIQPADPESHQQIADLPTEEREAAIASRVRNGLFNDADVQSINGLVQQTSESVAGESREFTPQQRVQIISQVERRADDGFLTDAEVEAVEATDASSPSAVERIFANRAVVDAKDDAFLSDFGGAMDSTRNLIESRMTDELNRLFSLNLPADQESGFTEDLLDSAIRDLIKTELFMLSGTAKNERRLGPESKELIAKLQRMILERSTDGPESNVVIAGDQTNGAPAPSSEVAPTGNTVLTDEG